MQYVENLNRDILDRANPAPYIKRAKKGLSERLIREISKDKNEPEWMLAHRLKSFKEFLKLPMPDFGPDLSDLDFENIIYYAKPGEIKPSTSWEKVPADIKKTFEKLGIPEAERKYLAGAGAQYESVNAYHSIKEKWALKGIIFEDMDAARQKYPDLVKQYFMKAVPPSNHKFAALHGAVWSGGTFIYIPEGICVNQPLQAYFRMNADKMGQFEHTLIIVEKGASCSYIEGCSSPKYESPSLHAGLVEIFVKEGAYCRYSSAENWSKKTYNLNTKRALVDKKGVIEWISVNMGSCATMLYPCSVLQGENASAEHLGVAFASAGQIQDTGAKIIHLAKNTNSKVIMKSISKGGGASIYRGLVKIVKGAKGAKSQVKCDALILDDLSKSTTVPDMKISENDVSVGHEATVGKISGEMLFYLMSRGLSENEAVAMIVNGFISPVIKQIPMEYAVEMNRLIELEMEGAVA